MSGSPKVRVHSVVWGSLYMLSCPGYCTSLDKFSILLSQQRPFSPPGEQLHSYTSQDGATCNIYKVMWSLFSLHFSNTCLHCECQASLQVTGFKEYLSRLQPLLLWFIEAASYIGKHKLYILCRNEWMSYSATVCCTFTAFGHIVCVYITQYR